VTGASGVRLALFDLDHTLLEGDSDLEWGELLAERGLADAAQVRRFLEQYHAGTLMIEELLRFQIEPLARHPMASLEAWRAEFLERRIRPRLGTAGRELVARHAALGHELALVTATNRFLAEPIAAELGVPHVIATEPERQNGRFTGRWLEPPCFREGKLAALDRWLAARGLAWENVEESWFYSDSHNDLPLLERVDYPVAVRPDAVLLEHARSLGWLVLH
jgi:HAD superfamily hydrolase (TIGR01490 family)